MEIPGPPSLWRQVFMRMFRAKIQLRIFWDKYGNWISGGSSLAFFTFGFTMIQVDEYFAALVCWAGACLCLWRVIVGILPKPTSALGRAAIGLIIPLGAFVFFAQWTNLKRGDKPWSAYSRYFIVLEPLHIQNPPTPIPPPWAFVRRDAVPKEIPDPIIGVDYHVMPSDPPYPPDTVVAGIKFLPGTQDVRLYLSVSRNAIKSCDLNITVINTTGQILGIYDIRQRSESPTIVATQYDMAAIPSIQVAGRGQGAQTVPLGGSSAIGSLESHAAGWRIKCGEIPENTKAELVIMASRPYKKPRMIEGFILDGSYGYDNGHGVKHSKLYMMTKFDSVGNPHIASKAEITEVLKHQMLNSPTEFSIGK